jgi:hypothetical protein
MKTTRLRLIAIAAVVMCLFAMIGISKPGRSVLTKLIARGRLALQAPADVEQRARAKHGWNAGVLNSVVKGELVDFDGNGMATRIAGFTLYRLYPDRLRLELDRRGSVEVSGFDGRDAWRQGAASLTEEAGRDIRAFLRVWPERLFNSRASGAEYSEAGRKFEDRRPAFPGQPAMEIQPPQVFDQVVITDASVPRAVAGRVPDERNVVYYVGSQDSTVWAARWLEPDDPRKVVALRSASLTDVRVDFGRWQQVQGVLWPMEVTHTFGGKVDWQMRVSEVRLNQSLAVTLFQRP